VKVGERGKGGWRGLNCGRAGRYPARWFLEVLSMVPLWPGQAIGTLFRDGAAAALRPDLPPGIVDISGSRPRTPVPGTAIGP
jgi:hypothetical protein